MGYRRGRKSGPETMKERALSLSDRVTHEVGLHRQALRRTLATPDGHEASVAAKRTGINAAISAIDAVPLVGDIPSWIADGLKVLVHMRRGVRHAIGHLRKKPVSDEVRPFDRLDLTPDVSLKWAVYTEALELFALAGLPVPTHAIESTMQLYHDVPRFRRGFSLYRKFLREERQPKLPVTPAGSTTLPREGDIDPDDVIDITPEGDR